MLERMALMLIYAIFINCSFGFGHTMCVKDDSAIYMPAPT